MAASKMRRQKSHAKRGFGASGREARPLRTFPIDAVCLPWRRSSCGVAASAALRSPRSRCALCQDAAPLGRRNAVKKREPPGSWVTNSDWSDSRALRSARRYGCAWSHPSAPTRHVAAHTAQSVRPPPRSASPPPLTPMLAWQREHALPSSSAQKRACAKRPVRVLYSAPHSAHGQPRPFDDGRARTSMRTVCSTLPRGRLRTCEGGMGWPAASTLGRRTRTLRECAADGPVQSAAPGVAVDTD
mmetsp:Transcript_8968/g.19544  ORF Transcript_8968/g.19544 Transcript_8968/m.19544 type:complete len:244 (-) Transcript_8968:433-1164(-)